MPRTRKEKKSSSTKKQNPIAQWVTFVKKVQKEEGLSYKDAIMRASERKKKGENWTGGDSTDATVASAPVEEKKEETSVEEKKEETPVEEKKEETPAEEKKEETPAEEKKEETPAEEKKEDGSILDTIKSSLLSGGKRSKRSTSKQSKKKSGTKKSKK